MPAVGPLRVHPANPHYFEFRGQPTLLVTSAEHYGAVDDAEVTLLIRSETAPNPGAAADALQVYPTHRRYFTDGTTNADGSPRGVYLAGHGIFVDLHDNAFHKE